MSQMILKDGEMIRISPKDSNKLEYSTTNGRSWSTRMSRARGWVGTAGR